MIEIEAWTEDDLWPADGRELLIVGPPGTGKTRTVLTHYVWPVLRQSGTALATSFTRAAAGELRERTARELGGDAGSWRQSLTTMHSEAWRRCAHLGIEKGRAAGAPKPGEVEEAGDEDLQGRGEYIEALAAADKKFLAAWDRVRHVRPQDRHLPVRERLRWMYPRPADLDEAEAAVRVDLHGRYDDAGRLVRPDFTSLLELALDQGSERSVDLLAIDEAQDLSPLEWQLADVWAATARQVLVVGDPDQAIYGWSGADGVRLLRWMREGRAARRLARSWRVPRSVHALARQVVMRVQNRVDAPYTPCERDGAVVTRWSAHDASRALAGAQDAGQSGLALSRTRAGCAALVDQLLADGVPHIAERGRRVLSEQGAAVRIASALCRWCLWSSRASPAEARKMVSALRASGPILAGCPRGTKKALIAALSGRESDVPASLLADHGIDLDEMTRQWCEPRPGWWESALLESVVGAPDLFVLRDWLASYGSLRELLEAARLVVVTTCHGAKGREADLVVLDARSTMRLTGGEAGLQTDAEKRDEDLRVLYVGITRAKERLLILRSDDGRRDWLDLHGIRVTR